MSSERPLTEADADPDPFAQFDRWYREAELAGVHQPDAMALATSTPDGMPSVRMVLFKGLDRRGLAFFTNRESRKGRELAANPRAAGTLYWVEQRRQIRVAGSVAPMPDGESAAYFASRPREAQLAAWASRQSQVIENRDALQRRYDELAAGYEGGPIPRPPFWGGYRLTPDWFEFWQGRENRMHDRLRYVPDDSGWRIERLAP